MNVASELKPASPEVPKAITVRVGEEILKSNFEADAWARALASVHGGHEQVVAEYARLRIAQLTEQGELARKKKASHEQRRLDACLGVKTVREMLSRLNQGGAGNLHRPQLPFIWLFILLIGASGCTASFLRLFADEYALGLEGWLPVVALGGGVLLVSVVLLLKAVLSSQLLHWFWGEGLVAVCALICLASLYSGARVMQRNPHQLGGRSAVAENASMAESLQMASSSKTVLDEVAVPTEPVMANSQD